MVDYVQTTYSNAPPVGRPGQEYDCAFSDVISLVASEVIPFGLYCVQSAAGQAELPDSSAEITAAIGGIALVDPTKAANATQYEIGDVVRVLRSGRAFVANEEALAIGDTLFVRHTTGTGTQKGSFRNDADTATAATPPRATLYLPAGINLAVVELG
jgi:hypothetical protein